jgi:FlaA1/EpsC-like NDP-sugar epimerase
LRFDGGIPGTYHDLFARTVTFAVIAPIAAFALVGCYRHSSSYSTHVDYLKIGEGALLGVFGLVFYVTLVQPKLVPAPTGFVSIGVPAGVLVLWGLMMAFFVAGTRFAVHVFNEGSWRGFAPKRDARSVLIVGAGEGGALLLKEILRNPQLNYRPVGFVDDDPDKQGVSKGPRLRVLGTTEQLPDVLEDVEPDEVLIAIPSAPGTLRSRVVMACRDFGVPVRTMPTVFEMLQSGGGLSVKVRDVRVEDVLGREPVHLEVEHVGGYLTDRVVMVTGAGGSIGSELCRQISRVGPRSLVLVDHAEDNLFEIERELVEDRHVLNTVAVLADCREEERMREVFATERPEVVFHAAAYKHVALMENHPVEAVRNNAFATRVMTQVAGEAGVGAFVLVSTDKAVAPKTAMGASKALAEWAVEAAAARYEHTAFSAVRFGNVLGSSGSVVPIFRRQIAAGGPLTVTDREMTRFFMTIPEAVQLVIRAGSLATGGEIFALEMGEPVNIFELAEDMIRFSGLEPGKDIAIEIIGPRPGEKLHEQLFNGYERPAPTPAQKIMRAERVPADPAWVEWVFESVSLLIEEGDAAGLAGTVAELASSRMALPEGAADAPVRPAS